MQEGPASPSGSIALITSIAYSLANFRGPLIEALIARGLHVYALAPDYDESTRTAVRRLGAEPVDIALERTGMRPVRDLRDTVRLVLQLRSLKPDIVLSYFVKPVIYGSLAAWAAGVKQRFALVAGLGYVFTPKPGGDGLRRRLLQHAISLLYALAFRMCRRVFFQNEEDVAHFIDSGLIPERKVVKLNGTGVDLARYDGPPPPSQPPRFLLMARLLREKGIGEYAEAARIVRRSHPDVEFELLGGLDPNPGGLAREEVRAWHDEGVLRWAGHVDDVLPALGACSVYVLPSYYREGVPRSIQEAMAMGRPVITTDWVGCRETVEEGVNGFLVPVRDVPALVAAIERFLEEPALIARMGRESRSLAEQRFDVHQINARMLAAMGLAPSENGAETGAIVSDAGCG